MTAASLYPSTGLNMPLSLRVLIQFPVDWRVVRGDFHVRVKFDFDGAMFEQAKRLTKVLKTGSTRLTRDALNRILR